VPWRGGLKRAQPVLGFLNLIPRKVFLMVTRLYFSTKEGGERSVCLSFAFLFLLLAMLVQVVREETLELGLEPGRYASLLSPRSLSVSFSFSFFPTHSVALAGLRLTEILILLPPKYWG
jgi:hypothetical protein